MKNTKATALICNQNTLELAKKLKLKVFFIVSETPELVFMHVLKSVAILKDKQFINGIHNTAIVSPECIIGKNVSIGAYTIIDKAIIGDNCKISNNVRIYSDVEVGNNVIVREFCSIGGDGFGFVKNKKNVIEHMPHIGKVIIEDDVHIFPFSNIDKGTLSETILRRGVKIDHYCHIGHNCEIGANTIITAKVTTCGGVSIGNDCFIGVNTIVKNNLKIGNFVTIGLGSVVTKNIPDNEIWFGVPAKKKD